MAAIAERTYTYDDAAPSPVYCFFCFYTARVRPMWLSSWISSTRSIFLKLSFFLNGSTPGSNEYCIVGIPQHTCHWAFFRILITVITCRSSGMILLPGFPHECFMKKFGAHHNHIFHCSKIDVLTDWTPNDVRLVYLIWWNATCSTLFHLQIYILKYFFYDSHFRPCLTLISN